MMNQTESQEIVGLDWTPSKDIMDEIMYTPGCSPTHTSSENTPRISETAENEALGPWHLTRSVTCDLPHATMPGIPIVTTEISDDNTDLPDEIPSEEEFQQNLMNLLNTEPIPRTSTPVDELMTGNRPFSLGVRFNMPLEIPTNTPRSKTCRFGSAGNGSNTFCDKCERDFDSLSVDDLTNTWGIMESDAEIEYMNDTCDSIDDLELDSDFMPNEDLGTPPSSE